MEKLPLLFINLDHQQPGFISNYLIREAVCYIFFSILFFAHVQLKNDSSDVADKGRRSVSEKDGAPELQCRGRAFIIIQS